ncbi:MAG TPA: ABC transporter ATP-binding protein, partial [Steroidobacteraceae bacterium]|nr:ABC transporter ATP-binding protein [Steroidobacteraceae bacterium]
TSTLVFEGSGQINEYVGGYSDWLQQRRVAKPAAPGKAGKPATAGTATASKPRRLSYNEQRELKELPESIQRLEAEQAQLTALISDPALFRRNQEQGSEALQRLQALGEELDAAYARWEALDTASNANRA